MTTRSLARALSLLLPLALLITACTGSPQAPPASVDPAATMGPTTAPSLDPDAEADWDAQADPNSRYGFGPLYGLETVVRPDARPMSAQEAQAITQWRVLNAPACETEKPDRPKCEYEFAMSPLPDGIVVGSVLAAAPTPVAPNGVLARVTSLTANGGRATEATLDQALAQGEIDIDQKMDPARATDERLHPGVTRGKAPASPGGPEGALGVPVVKKDDLFRYDLDVTLADGVKMTGHLAFNAWCGVRAGLTYTLIIPDGAYFEAGCELTQSSAIDVVADVARQTDRVEIADVHLDTIVVWVGPVPVWIKFTLVVSVGMDGKASAKLNFGASESLDIGIGIGYRGGWKKKAEFKVAAEKHSSNLSAKVDVRGAVQAEVRAMIYGLVGVGLGGEAALRFQGNATDDPRWCLTLTGGVFVSAHIDLWIDSFHYGPKRIFSKTFEVGCAENQPPVITLIRPQDGAEVQLGYHLSGPGWEARADDPEQGQLAVRWTSDKDGVLGDTLGSATGTLKGLTTIGTHVITLEATDRGGLTDRKSIRVTVKAPTLRASFELLDQNMAVIPPDASAGRDGDTIYAKPSISGGPYATVEQDCRNVTWSAPDLTITPVDSCIQEISLAEGSHTITMTLTNPWGPPIVQRRTIDVASAPSVITPKVRFLATRQGGAVLKPGDDFFHTAPIILRATYTNPDSAGVELTYHWTVRREGGAIEPLTYGSDSATESLRSFQLTGYFTETLVFACIVRNKAGGTEVARYEIELRYVGPPL